MDETNVEETVIDEYNVSEDTQTVVKTVATAPVVTVVTDGKKIRGTIALVKSGLSLVVANWWKCLIFGFIAFLLTTASVYTFKQGEAFNEYLKTGQIQGTLPEAAGPVYDESMSEDEVQRVFEEYANQAVDTSEVLPIAMFLTPIIIIIGILVSFAFYKVLYDSATGVKPLSLQELTKLTLKKSPGYLLVGMLVAVSVFAGTILFVIPGFFVALWLIFFPQVYIIEDVKGLGVLKRSKEISKGFLLPIFGRLLLVLLMALLVSITIGALPYVHILTNIVITPLVMAIMYYIYKDIVDIKSV